MIQFSSVAATTNAHWQNDFICNVMKLPVTLDWVTSKASLLKIFHL